MPSLKTKACLAALLALALAWPAAAIAGPVLKRIQAENQLRVGTTGEYPPLSAKGSDGKLIGLDVDLANLLAQRLGVRLKLVQLPAGRLLKALEAGEVDLAIAGLTINLRDSLRVTFVGPYLASGQTLLTSAEVGQSLKALADVDHPEFSLAVARGSSGEEVARQMMPKAKILAQNSMQGALQMLLAGKVKAVIADYPFCALAVFQHRDAKLGLLEKPFTYEPLGIALAQGDPEFVNLLRNYLLLMQGSGRLDMLRQRWLKREPWLRLLPR